jgi:hypothetical protein
MEALRKAAGAEVAVVAAPAAGMADTAETSRD